MITQRVIFNADGSADLIVHAPPIGLGELMGLKAELALRSTVTTEGDINRLNTDGGGTPSIPDLDSITE